MTRKEFAEALFPNCRDKEYYEKKYPQRNLSEGAMVTRFAPSPTGFVHMGSLYAAFISNIFAKQTNGVFYIRIEDTDQKRLVENGIEGILKDLETYELLPEEDPIQGGKYAPYIQSERKEIYESYVKYLVEQDLAYPCFCTEDELQEMRKIQESKKERIGYYGKYAKYRNMSPEEAISYIEQGNAYVIRLRSNGNFEKKVLLHDCIKGNLEFPENDMDIVIMKQDGLPTYHFAHAIDDHLMHTTHVIRGDEWLSSYPIHHELFEVLGFEEPRYAHIAPLTKVGENGTVRKLSKRYDKECSIHYYEEEGIPKEAVKLYLATIMNSNFEEWYSSHSKDDMNQFPFTFEKMAIGGSLFDLQKLESISKIYFSTLSAKELYEIALPYMEKYQKEFANLMKKDPEYTISVLNVERNTERPRKDIAKLKDIIKYHGYMYDELFFSSFCYEDSSKKYDLDILKYYLEGYQETDSEEDWLSYTKEFAEKMGYAKDRKSYKANPEKYKGNLQDVCEVIRVAITGSNQSPNLYYLLKLLGKDRIQKRFERMISVF